MYKRQKISCCFANWKRQSRKSSRSMMKKGISDGSKARPRRKRLFCPVCTNRQRKKNIRCLGIKDLTWGRRKRKGKRKEAAAGNSVCMKTGHHYRWPVFALWEQHAAAYGKMETFEVSLMRCIYKGKQFSWLLALSVPPGIAGFILHTPYSFLWGIIGFILCGLIGPFLYYLSLIHISEPTRP